MLCRKEKKLAFLALAFTSSHSRMKPPLLFTLITDRFKIVLHSKFNSTAGKESGDDGEKREK